MFLFLANFATMLFIAGRPNHDLVYPIGVDFCLESAESFPLNVTIQCQLAESVFPLPILEISAASSSGTDIKRQLAIASHEVMTYGISLSQDDLSSLFEDGGFPLIVTCVTRNDFGQDDESTNIHICCKYCGC